MSAYGLWAAHCTDSRSVLLNEMQPSFSIFKISLYSLCTWMTYCTCYFFAFWIYHSSGESSLCFMSAFCPLCPAHLKIKLWRNILIFLKNKTVACFACVYNALRWTHVLFVWCACVLQLWVNVSRYGPQLLCCCCRDSVSGGTGCCGEPHQCSLSPCDCRFVVPRSLQVRVQGFLMLGCWRPLQNLW